jgi:type I restriction enzyme M protein
MVQLVDPQPGERCGDPACGTFGFMISADHYIKGKTDNLFDLPEKQQESQRKEAFSGVELVQDAHRLALMNAMLHDINGQIMLGDTLSDAGKKFKDFDVILTNPPFGTKKGGERPTRDDLTLTTSNKQLNFLQVIYKSLKPGGRAAVVLPDNVLFEGNVGKDIRRDLMEKCNLHTILRLPTGIFYAQGVKTNVLFFTRGVKVKGNTKEVWVYDLRANMPNFGKRTLFGKEYFKEFIDCYGADPHGKAKRKDLGEASRFRCFTREWIRDVKDGSLDIAWLKDDSDESADGLPEPAILAQEAMGELEAAMAELRGVLAELGGGVEE